jgi:hypothetical protein
VPGLFFFFVFLGEDSFQHIARFGDVRQIDLRDHRLLPKASAS